MLHYLQLLTTFFPTQCFLTSNSWTGHKCEGDAHNALSLLFLRDGVSPAMIVDNSKEQLSYNFCKKINKANCQLQQTKPYSPWQQTSESNIWEVKHSFAHLMMKSNAPKVLWNFCLKLAAAITSHIWNSLYSTGNEVPEMIMFGTMADISTICQFAWYDWVMFRNTAPTFPDDMHILG